MTQNKINYSIIIPHKNTPDLLRVCLDSIPQRDDVQIIVVDDDSDIDKVDFEHFPGLGEPHTEVYLTKEGRGAGYARNVGLEHAVGKWIVFADADDFFLPDFDKAMDEYVNSDWEVIFFKGTSIVRPSMEPGHRCDGRNEMVQNAIETDDYRYLFTTSSPYTKFILKSLIDAHHIRFHEVRWSNDVYFGAMCALYATKFTASPIAMYCVTSTPNSLIHNTSLECRRIRCIEAITETALLYPKFGKFGYMNYWFYRAWYNLWNADKWEAIKLIPKCAKSNNGYFFRYLWKYLLIDTYNDSKRIKLFIRRIKSKHSNG